MALRYAVELSEWYYENRFKIRHFLTPIARQVLSCQFNHLLALFNRPSLWIATRHVRIDQSGNRPSISTLFRPSAMILYGARHGGRYVGLFKHSFELCIKAVVRVCRYSRLTGCVVDSYGCWEMVLENGWKHLELNGTGSSLIQRFSTWASGQR